MPFTIGKAERFRNYNIGFGYVQGYGVTFHLVFHRWGLSGSLHRKYKDINDI